MFRNYPEKVSNAIEVLYRYSMDAYISSRTKKELDKEGYECSKKMAMKFTFILPYPSKKKEDKDYKS